MPKKPFVTRVKKKLHHFFLPRQSNNYRAKLLHNTSLFFAVLFFIVLTLTTSQVHTKFPNVLGISTDITLDSLLSLTNVQRTQNGLSSLSMNPALSAAAQKKAEDMFSKNYWAHNAPDGTTPWVFIKNAGYDYLYAGENLARGFTTTQDAINAWMASPDHKRNILSKNYNDVGFAVQEGRLGGEQTILIVEEFGSKAVAAPAVVPVTLQLSKSAETAPAKIPKLQTVIHTPIVNSFNLSKHISEVILSLFILTFILDMIIVERKRIVRFVGHNEDHVFYLLTILVMLIAIIGKGAVL